MHYARNDSHYLFSPSLSASPSSSPKMNVRNPPASSPLIEQPQTYPAVNPYPPTQSAPSTGPGSGFPPKSGLAGMTPHSMSSTPVPNMAPGAGVRGGLPEERNVAQRVRENTNIWARKWQGLLDRSTPHVLERWLVTLGLFLLFALNVILRQGVSNSPYRVAYLTNTGHVNADIKDLLVVHCMLRPCHLHPQPIPRVPPASIRPVIG